MVALNPDVALLMLPSTAKPTFYSDVCDHFEEQASVFDRKMCRYRSLQTRRCLIKRGKGQKQGTLVRRKHAPLFVGLIHFRVPLSNVSKRLPLWIPVRQVTSSLTLSQRKLYLV